MNKSLSTLLAIAIAASAMAVPMTAFSFPRMPDLRPCDKRTDSSYCSGHRFKMSKYTPSQTQTAPPDEVLNLRLTPPAPAGQGSATQVPSQPAQNAAPGR